MRERLLRDAEAVSRMVAELHDLRGDGRKPRQARTEVGRSTGSAGPRSPIEDSTFSLLDETMRRLREQMAEIHQTVPPITHPDQVQPCTHAPTIVGALAAHIDQLPPERTVGLEDEHRILFARTAQELTAQLGLAAFKCPERHRHIEPDRIARSMRKHIEENLSRSGKMITADSADNSKVRFASLNLRYRTVIPEWVTPGGRKGMYMDVDPGCIDADGDRRRFRLEELLPLGPATPVTLKEAAALTGHNYHAMYMAAVVRTKQPLVQRGERTEAGRKSATFWIGDILTVPAIAKWLTVLPSLK